MNLHMPILTYFDRSLPGCEVVAPRRAARRARSPARIFPVHASSRCENSARFVALAFGRRVGASRAMKPITKAQVTIIAHKELVMLVVRARVRPQLVARMGPHRGAESLRHKEGHGQVVRLEEAGAEVTRSKV